MNKSINFNIKTPCAEDFNQFLPTHKGGFCDSCNKEVIDFTQMEAGEIMAYFSNNNTQDVCGRFRTSQLTTYKKPVLKESNLGFLTGFGLALLSLFTPVLSQAQETTKPLETNDSKVSINDNILQEKEIKVEGTVTESSQPLPGVNVVLEGTTIGTSTDFDGKFVFPEKLAKGDVLVFSFIGMIPQRVTISDEHAATKVDLKVDMSADSCILMGKVAVKKVYSSNNK